MIGKTLVPFMPGGVDTNLAQVMGLTRDGEQVVLMVEYTENDPVTGTLTLTKRIFQRDRDEIERLAKDGEQTGHTVRVLRGGCHKYGVTLDSQYIHSSGDEHVFDNVLLVMNKSEGSSTMWSAEVFNYER